MAQNAEKWAIPFLWLAHCCKRSTKSSYSQKVARKTFTGSVRERIGGPLSPRTSQIQFWEGVHNLDNELTWAPESNCSINLLLIVGIVSQASIPGTKGTPYGCTLTHYLLMPREAKCFLSGYLGLFHIMVAHWFKDSITKDTTSLPGNY